MRSWCWSSGIKRWSTIDVMNVLLLAEVSAERVLGGAERVLREQACALAARGQQVSIVARALSDQTRSDQTVPVAKIGTIPEYQYGVSREHELDIVLSSIRGALRAFDAARAHSPPHVVIIHQALVGLGPVLVRRRETRFIYLCHSLAHEEYRSRQGVRTTAMAAVRHRLNTLARFWTERVVIRRCARVVVLSEFMRHRVRSFHGIAPDRIRVIPGAVDQKRFRPAADRQHWVEIRNRLHLPTDRTILFTVRNLVSRMGLEALVDAMSMIRKDGQDPLLLIGGQGPLHADLAARIDRLGLSSQVRLLGFVPESSLPDYYRMADLVVLPTHELEGFGLIAVEALASGTLVVGTPVGAIPELLSRVDPMLITDGSDAPALAGSISRLLRRFRDRPAEQERLSLAGRQLVEKEYTWGRHAEELETVLQEVCGLLGTESVP
jgi:glycosyltransferase involved in cell wall biosynthesis